MTEARDALPARAIRVADTRLTRATRGASPATVDACLEPGIQYLIQTMRRCCAAIRRHLEVRDAAGRREQRESSQRPNEPAHRSMEAPRVTQLRA